MKLFLIILMLIIFKICSSNEEELKTDDICKITEGILCVRDVLMKIATIVKSINRTTNEIEKIILNNNNKIIDTLNRYIRYETVLIQSQIPIPQFHRNFFQLNNIDKKYLGNLFLEGHYSMSFYYNSINDLLKMNIFSSISKSWFKQIEFNLKNEIICQYRNILNVYSYEWLSIKEINSIKFSLGKYHDTPSITHDVHSIIIVRLLRQWMQDIHSVIINLKMKFT